VYWEELGKTTEAKELIGITTSVKKLLRIAMQVKFTLMLACNRLLVPARCSQPLFLNKGK
jgi:hypothetical protein